MGTVDRTEMILASLRQTGHVSVVEVSRQAGVSEMTVRRDLTVLEQQGLLKRVHGGAAPVASRSFEPAFTGRLALSAEQKKRIGARAASMITPGATVIVDAGTTALEAARCLPQSAGLTVCPLGLQALAVLADRTDLRLLVPGGEPRPGEGALVGDLTAQTLARLHFDVYLMAVGGVHPTRGLTDFDLADVAIKRIAIAQSDLVIVVTDSTKVGAVAFAQIGPVVHANTLVTDTDADPTTIAALTEAGLAVALA